ncbi:MAG: hypothetical protein KC561_16510, partial [Myxococcales bacterium]|nr:hypothetical protein [Myxococcales bacterium]
PKGNAPGYLGYTVIPEFSAHVAEPVVHTLPTEELNSVVLATDGIGDLDSRSDVRLRNGSEAGDFSQFWNDANYLTNQAALQRRLNQLGPVNRVLQDDLAVAILGRQTRKRDIAREGGQ